MEEKRNPPWLRVRETLTPASLLPVVQRAGLRGCHLCAGEFLESCSQEILRGDSHLVLLQIAPLTTHLGLHVVGQILEKFHFLPFKSWNLTRQTARPENQAVRGLVAFSRVFLEQDPRFL